MSTASSRLPFPSACFENLPVELHWLILSALPDYSSLRSVVLASPSAHAAYNISAESIQRDVVRRVLSDSPELLIESHELHKAFHRRRNWTYNKDNMDGFLAYSGSAVEKKPGSFPLLSLETVLAEGLRFHLIVEDLTATFLQSAIHSYRNRRSAAPKDNFRNLPLQHTERTRIQRALYRFQRLCEIRQSTIPTRPARRIGRHPLFHFVHALPAWELEELCSIYRFLVQRLSFFHDSAYDSVVGGDMADDTARYRSIERAASMGLVFLQELETATTETRLKLLKQCSPTNPVLSDVLKLPRAIVSARIQTQTKMLGRQSLSKPSPGMALYQAEHLDTPGAQPLHELQDWGYCFWGNDRLEAWDVYDRRTEEPDGRAAILREAQINHAKIPPASHKATDLPGRRSWTERVSNLGTSLQLWRRR